MAAEEYCRHKLSHFKKTLLTKVEKHDTPLLYRLLVLLSFQ